MEEPIKSHQRPYSNSVMIKPKNLIIACKQFKLNFKKETTWKEPYP